ncbi:MAG: pentapeptide repeat-containing protein [Thermosynechococcaceae cyanobacterium MS004]|nr:pentapeptide repeat-containing protein [Thermosynechococcaceae cyanobacterium MS004]
MGSKRGVLVAIGAATLGVFTRPAIAIPIHLSEHHQSEHSGKAPIPTLPLQSEPMAALNSGNLQKQGLKPSDTTLEISTIYPVNIAQSPTTLERLIQSRSCQECDLSNANLKGLDLSGVDLRGANLSNADLSGANLTDADLSGANLYLAKLGSSVLVNTKLTKANWIGAKAEQINLTGADLSEATLSYAVLTGAILTGANLSRANGSDAILNQVNFNQANLTQANLRNADLSGSTFSQANLSNALLINANLSDANLQDANLAGANLTGAQLIQASLPPESTATTASTLSTPSTTAQASEGSYTPTPLELLPIRLFNLETANQLPAGALSFSVGARNFLNQTSGAGFGRQVNLFKVDYGVTDRLQIGLAGDLFSDALEKPVAGRLSRLKTLFGAAEVKYQVLKQDKLSISVLGSAELLNIRTNTDSFLSGAPLATGFQGRTLFAGSVQVPLTYSLSKQFQISLTPGVSFFPETFQGEPFYGTVFSLGAGFSWQPLTRLNVFADVRVPLGPGGNSIRTGDASIAKNVVWSGGFRFLVNPAAALDIYVTNAFGTTPATQVLSFIPDSNQVAIAAILNFTPEISQNYAPDFRNKVRVSLTPRDKQLLLDGFTIPTADTLLPRTLRVRGGIGAGKVFNIATGLTNDVQLEFLANEFSGPTDTNLKPDLLRLGAAAKIRFLDQVQGDPFSLSARATFQQTLTEANGFFEGGVIFQYRPIPQLALILEPKAAVFGGDRRFGTGLGVNFQIWKGVQLIGEYTPVFAGQNKTGIWSVGVRYLDPKLGLGFDVYGSNAVGLDSIGTLIGRPEPSIGFNIHWLFGGP